MHTLAIGHHQVTASVEHDRVQNPGGDLIMTNAEARRVGLLWSRRRGAEKRAVMDLSHVNEETEEEALAAGRQMRAGIRAVVNQIPDLPDRYDPTDRPPLRHRNQSKNNENSAPSSGKYRRIELAPETEDEEEDSSALNTPISPLSSANNRRNTPQRFPSIRWPTAGQVQATRKTHSGKRARANQFVEDEAEDAGDEEDETATSRTGSSSRSSNTSRTQNEADRESDSDSDFDLSFVVDDDWVE